VLTKYYNASFTVGKKKETCKGFMFVKQIWIRNVRTNGLSVERPLVVMLAGIEPMGAAAD
jgi:hypothetical protein